MKIWLWVLFEGSCKLKGSTYEAWVVFSVELQCSMRKDWLTWLKPCIRLWSSATLHCKNYTVGPQVISHFSFFQPKRELLHGQRSRPLPPAGRQHTRAKDPNPPQTCRWEHTNGHPVCFSLFSGTNEGGIVFYEVAFLCVSLFLCLSWKERSDLRSVIWAEVTGLSR